MQVLYRQSDIFMKYAHQSSTSRCYFNDCLDTLSTFFPRKTAQVFVVQICAHDETLARSGQSLEQQESSGKVSTKRKRRPSILAQTKMNGHPSEHGRLSKQLDKKRPTLRFSEMIRNDWTTFSRERAHEFGDVEGVVYAPWKQLCLSHEDLERLGVNIKAVLDAADSSLTARKSSWYASFIKLT